VGVFLNSFRSGLKPDPKISIVEWSDTYRILPSESSAEPGRYRTSRMPYLKEIATHLSPESPVEKVTVIKGTQLGLTELANNMLFTYADLYPCPMLLVLPTETLAMTHASDKLWPSVEKTERLKDKIYPRKKDGGSKILDVRFPGGNIKIGYSFTTATFASVSRRIVIKDDLDRWPDDVKGEGNPSDLCNKRTDAFPNRKIYANSSPTRSGTSKIQKEYDNSSMASFKMPCNSCNNFFSFEFDYFKFDYDKEKYMLKGSVSVACPECGTLTDESSKVKMMSSGEWMHEHPEKAHKGYRIPSYYSPFLRWDEIFQEFLDAKKAMKKGDVTSMVVWKNTRDATTWEEEYDVVELNDISSRIEEYPAEVPDGVFVITAGVDTQDDRYEVEVLGHGKDGETWSIDFNVIQGDPKDKNTESALDAYLQKTFKTENGAEMKIFATAIDTGGHRTKVVYDFCKKRGARRVYAIKGAKPIDAPLVNKRATTTNLSRVQLFAVGVNVAKDDILSKIVIEEPGPGFMHFPKKPIYNKNYFDQLTAEKRGKDGRWINPSKKRNEALDCRVYAIAALVISSVSIDKMKSPLLYIGAKQEKAKPKKAERRQTSHLDEF